MRKVFIAAVIISSFLCSFGRLSEFDDFLLRKVKNFIDQLLNLDCGVDNHEFESDVQNIEIFLGNFIFEVRET